jgi:long-chain acyl-CoA synthetase
VDGVSIAHRVAVREAHAPNPFPRSSYDAAVTDLASVPVIDDAGTELLSRAAADHLGSRVVGTLSAQGHRPGARVAFCAPNSALLLAAVWGCLRAGYAPVVLSATLMPRERTEMVADIEPAVLFGADDLAVAVDGPPGALADRFSCRPIHFTSGTSGRPKGVWSGWLPPEHADALVADEHDAWDFTGTDRHLVCSPLSHSAPLRFALHTLHHGGSVLLPPGFDPAVAGRLLAERDVTTTFMAPAHLQRLLATERPRATALRLLAFAGSFCPPPVRAAAVQTFGPDVVREFYGSTEGQFTVCTPDEERRRPGTVGRARPGRALRVDDTGRIWCRPPAHARFEYWGDPAKTAESWDGEWFTVGDLGRVDDDGYLFLDGRRQRPGHQRRGERVPGGDRAGVVRAPRRPAGGRVRPAGRAVGTQGLCRRRGQRHRAGGGGVLRRPPRALQAAEGGPPHRAVARHPLREGRPAPHRPRLRRWTGAGCHAAGRSMRWATNQSRAAADEISKPVPV